jgi:hypothetical protein
MNIFDKLKALEEKLAESSLKDVDQETFKRACQVLSNKWQYQNLSSRRKVKLTELEVSIYEFLLSNGFKPGTTYKWLLLKESHPELKSKLSARKISIKEAFKLKKENKPLMNVSESELRLDLNDLIEVFFAK